jgi:Protein of unknown function (DUF3616)
MKLFFTITVFFGLLAVANARGDVVSTQTFYYGMCDASAAVALNNDLYAVANDEDNALRIYHAMSGGPPLQSVDLSSFLGVDPKKPETDLEGACWLGDQIFWISSHGRNREGEYRSSRHRFFATKVEMTAAGVKLVLAGRVYTGLLSDLLREPRFRSFELAAASRLPPKSPGALNIEGLCPTRQGHLLIGFRNPIPRGHALLIPLLNPTELLAGKSPRFGEPILLNLGGLGVREIALWQNDYLIVAGSHDGRGRSRLYQWAGGNAEPREISEVDLKDFNAEALLVYPDHRWPFQLLSDDGTMMIDGVACKSLANGSLKRFRSLWVTLPKVEK